MGATNCPETPRQRMISMMYLVYTAMLALNVSAEILNSFITVGDSMEVTNKLLLDKTTNSYQMFAAALKGNPDKVKANYDKAMQVQKESKAMVNYIDSLKYALIAHSNGLKGGVEEAKKLVAESYMNIPKKDEISNSVNFFLGSGAQDGSAGNALKLRQRIEAYQAKMLALCPERNRDAFKKMQIKTNGKYKNEQSGQEQNWQVYNFYQNIVVADVVVLNKLKSEVINQEYDVVNNLFSDVSADDFKVDRMVAKVIPKETYVLQGGTFEAEVIAAAWDSHTALRGTCAAGNITETDSGTLRLKIAGNAVGKRTYNGTIFVKKETGEVPYDFSGEFFVAPPTITISPTNMNVLYLGVDNPISVAAPGINSNDLVVSINGAGGAIRKNADGTYTANVKSQGKTTISVSAKVGGGVKSLGSMNFRCKQIPKPIVKVGNNQDGKIAKEVLISAGGMRVDKGDFEFPVNFSVASYRFEVVKGGDADIPLNGTGNRFSQEMINKLRKLKRGNKVIISDIRIVGPTGTMSAANTSLTFTIQ